MITIRALSRLMKNKFSTFLEPTALQRVNPHFISVVCGFPKDIRAKYQIGKFGDDAWFTSNSKQADVIGENLENIADKTTGPARSPAERARRKMGIDLFVAFRLARSRVLVMHNKKMAQNALIKVVAQRF